MKKAILSLSIFILLSGCSALRLSENAVKYEPDLPPKKEIELALVLGAGGAKGLAHIAVIEELLAQGIKPDLIVGSSAGAIVGAMYADTLDIQKVKEQLLAGSSDKVFDMSVSSLPFAFSSGEKLHAYLSDNISAKRFEQLKMPFISVATNLQYGDLTAFSKGPLVPAVRASSAYPGAFYPVKIQGQYFVDGAVADPIPVEIARRMGAKKIIAVDISSRLPTSQPNHMLGLMKRSMEISYIHQSHMARRGADVVVDVEFDDSIGTFTDTANEFIYSQGKKAIQKVMKDKMLDSLKPQAGHSPQL